MKFRSTLVLLLLAGALGAFIWFFERGAETTEQSQLRAQFALRFDPQTVAKIDLASPAFRLRLSKQGDGWHIAEPLQTMADDVRVEQLLTHLVLLERSQIITAAQVKRAKQRRADYGLDQPRWKISFGDRDRETVLNIGGTAPTGDAIYLQLDGQRDVIVSPTNLLAALPASVADYRNRRLMPGTAEEVSRIELRSRAGFVQASRAAAGGAWQIAKPVVARGDSAAILAALRPLFAAKIVDFEASSKVGASLYGFDEPASQCSILARDGTIEQTLLLGKIAEGRTNLVYATKQGDEEIFTVDRSLLTALERSADDLRDKRVLPLPPLGITGIRIEEGERTVALDATDGIWFVTSPRLAPADGKKIALAIAEWSGAHVRSFNDQPGTNAAALGFEPPAARYTFTTDAASREAGLPSNIVFETSSLSETGALRTLRMLGEEPLLRVDAATLSTMPAQPLYFRSPAVLSVDTGAVRSLAFESRTATNAVALDGTNAAPASATAALALLHPLRARTFVTEDTRELSSYGLQPAEATLTVGLKSTGSVSRILLFGKSAPDGGRYAAVQGLDLVFTLDARDADALLKPAQPAP